ncbi:MAG: hypothetical protein EOM26_10195 [Alphaproteobacteria bacterium]|nr:hypothetical protein [Alphaproteobacteria bacterium]
MPYPFPGYDMHPDKAWSNACDGDYMNTIFAQAWLKGQYDVIVNQTLILKPDSVFEYTCFTDFLDNTEENIAPLFSESQLLKELYVDIGTTRGPRIIRVGFAREIGSMAEVIAQAIRPALAEYIAGNFWHTYLGGTSGLDMCASMTSVWHEAKCVNFHPDHYGTDTDETFYEIEDFVNIDPRQHPDGLACDITAVSELLIQTTYNPDFSYVRQDLPVPPQSLADSYVELREHNNCSMPPVPVGITFRHRDPRNQPVREIGYEDVEEYVCPQQGCHYAERGGSCEP